ncbi:hypothetical protein DL98DRAFT_435854, partial [Cadophora sp. DSE1049]
DKARKITVLIEPMSGFTRRLPATYTTVKGYIDGLYSHSPVLDDYSNFIFFASGIGITAPLEK